MSSEQPDYLSYLLRLWRVAGKGRTAWLAGLESSLGGERQLFASMFDMLDFLKQQMGAELATDRDESRTESDVGCDGNC
jgi:hypothetical protein